MKSCSRDVETQCLIIPSMKKEVHYVMYIYFEDRTNKGYGLCN